MSGRPDDPQAQQRGPSPLGPAWARWVGRFLFRVVWDAQVIDRDLVPTSGPVVLAANHVHVVDGPMLIGLAPRPLHILVKQEMFHGPAGPVLRAAGQIRTDRGNGRAALTQGLAVLRRGGAVGIFPEGGRGAGTVDQARAGAAWLAVHGGAPVVPVAIVGTRRPGQSTSGLPPLRRRFACAFGAPLDLAGDDLPRRDAIATGTEAIRAALAELVVATAERTGLPVPGVTGTSSLGTSSAGSAGTAQ